MLMFDKIVYISDKGCNVKLTDPENIYTCFMPGVEVLVMNISEDGWAEIDKLVYDPEWSRHSSNYSYFGMSYDEPCDVGYKGAIGSASWMHVAV